MTKAERTALLAAVRRTRDLTRAVMYAAWDEKLDVEAARAAGNTDQAAFDAANRRYGAAQVAMRPPEEGPS
jgi:hypothetical protein